MHIYLCFRQELWLPQVFFVVKCHTRNYSCYLSTPCSQLACIHACLCICMCVKSTYQPFFFSSTCVCVHVHTLLSRLSEKERGMCDCLYVWVRVSIVFPGLRSRVALGAESPGCNTLIAELFTLYTNPPHLHFGRVPLPLALQHVDIFTA